MAPKCWANPCLTGARSLRAGPPNGQRLAAPPPHPPPPRAETPEASSWPSQSAPSPTFGKATDLRSSRRGRVCLVWDGWDLGVFLSASYLKPLQKGGHPRRKAQPPIIGGHQPFLRVGGSRSVLEERLGSNSAVCFGDGRFTQQFVYSLMSAPPPPLARGKQMEAWQRLRISELPRAKAYISHCDCLQCFL